MEPHPVKSAVEGLKRYGKENYDVIFEGTSGRHRQEAQHSLEKCGNLLKQQYVQLKFINMFWLSAISWRNLAKFNHNPLNRVFLLVLWLLEKWVVTLAQQNQRHEFSCPPNLSSSTRAAMTRWWSLKCDQHERVSISGISSTSVYNAVVTPTGASNPCLSIMVLFWNLFVCNMFMSTYWSPIFLFIFFQTFSWVYNESMEKMIQCY